MGLRFRVAITICSHFLFGYNSSVFVNSVSLLMFLMPCLVTVFAQADQVIKVKRYLWDVYVVRCDRIDVMHFLRWCNVSALHAINA